MFDLIEIIWNKESLFARPTKWNVDITAEDFDPETEGVMAVDYELTCPNCGAMCSFNIHSSKIECKECDSSTSNPVFVDQLVSEKDEVEISDLDDEISDLDDLDDEISDLDGLDDEIPNLDDLELE